MCSDRERSTSRPYAHALTYFLLGHDDTQDFGRKFKVAFSGCKDNPCGLTNFHDIGAHRRTRRSTARPKRGFEFYVGGGLGSVPYPAQLFDEFLPEEELLPMSQAVCRVFARLGEKENRARARIKFLVKKLGIEEFKRLVLEERDEAAPRSALDGVPGRPARDRREAAHARRRRSPRARVPAGFDALARRPTCMPQRQAGYVDRRPSRCRSATSPPSRRARVADMARQYTGDTLRTTVDQNLLFRWVSERRSAGAVRRARGARPRPSAGADTITDITSCPGTDTCKLGISSSRGLAGELRQQLTHRSRTSSTRRPRRCTSSAAAASTPAASTTWPTSASWASAATSTAAACRTSSSSSAGSGRTTPAPTAWPSAPSRRSACPKSSSASPTLYVKRASSRARPSSGFVNRIGKKTIRAMVEELHDVPTYEQDPSFY